MRLEPRRVLSLCTFRLFSDKGLCIKGVPEGPAYAVDIAGKDGSIVALSNYFLSKTGNDVSDLDARGKMI